jgi:hypothetical protein
VSLRTEYGTTLCVSFPHEIHRETTDGARRLACPPCREDLLAVASHFLGSSSVVSAF